MTSAFRPGLPGIDTRPYLGGRDSDEPQFDLVSYPDSENPALAEFLPHSSAIPVPFEATTIRGYALFDTHAKYVDTDRIVATTAHAVYTPSGRVSEDSVHAACRLIIGKETGTSTPPVSDYHEEELWRTFNGDPDRPLYSDWVTTDLDTTTVNDFDRTTYSQRRPILYLDGLSESVQRPVLEYAFVIQSTAWGLVETAVSLYPDPEQDRATEIAVSMGDNVLKQALEYPTPEPPEFGTSRTGERSDEQRSQ